MSGERKHPLNLDQRWDSESRSAAGVHLLGRDNYPCPKRGRGDYPLPPGAPCERQLVPVSGSCRDSLRIFPLTCSLRRRPYSGRAMS